MDGLHELSVLFPDCDVTVRDPDTREPVTLTVREFRFREGLEDDGAGAAVARCPRGPGAGRQRRHGR